MTKNFFIFYFLKDKQNQTSSLSEAKANKLIKEEHATNIIDYSSNFLVKIYPGALRSNLNPYIIT